MLTDTSFDFKNEFLNFEFNINLDEHTYGIKNFSLLVHAN